jgi:hypothetical protein
VKTATYELMKLYIAEGKILGQSHTLTDEELLHLVEIEYGQTLQDVLQLFQCICKKYAKEIR